MDNRLYRSRATKMLGGVCGGLADMYNIDPTLVRLIAVALTFFSGFTFLVVYVICAIIIPLEPTPGYILGRHRREGGPAPGQAYSAQPAPPSATPAAETPAPEKAPEGPPESEEPPLSESVETDADGSVDQDAPKPAEQETETIRPAADETVVYSESDRY